MISIHALLAESDAMTAVSGRLSAYFYTRSPCGERHYSVYVLGRVIVISIHALLAESDRPPHLRRDALQHFYPRSPCGERQAVLHVHFFCVTISIHALLAESDDNSRHCSPRNTQNFYPRSPCGERHFTFTADTKQKQFLSTLSLRRATEVVVQRVVESGISIHALLAESDF